MGVMPPLRCGCVYGAHRSAVAQHAVCIESLLEPYRLSLDGVLEFASIQLQNLARTVGLRKPKRKSKTAGARPRGPHLFLGEKACYGLKGVDAGG